jgi:hypothetical protein
VGQDDKDNVAVDGSVTGKLQYPTAADSFEAEFEVEVEATDC